MCKCRPELWSKVQLGKNVKMRMLQSERVREIVETNCLVLSGRKIFVSCFIVLVMMVFACVQLSISGQNLEYRNSPVRQGSGRCAEILLETEPSAADRSYGYELDRLRLPNCWLLIGKFFTVAAYSLCNPAVMFLRA